MRKEDRDHTFLSGFLRASIVPSSLFSVGVEQVLAKGQSISPRQLKTEGFFVIVDGIIETHGTDSSGCEFISFILDKGTTFLESDMLEGVVLSTGSASSSFTAVVNTTLLFISRENSKKLLETDVEVARYIACMIAQKMHGYRSQLYNCNLHNVIWRLANLINEFGVKFGCEHKQQLLIRYPLSQETMAKILRINRVTVSKTIKQLKEIGIIEKVNQYYCIANQDALDVLLARGY